MAMKSCCANCGENLVLVLPPLLGDALAKLAKRTSRALENGFDFYLLAQANGRFLYGQADCRRSVVLARTLLHHRRRHRQL